MQAAKEMSQSLSSSRIIILHGQQSLGGAGWCITLYSHHLRRGWNPQEPGLGCGFRVLPDSRAGVKPVLSPRDGVGCHRCRILTMLLPLYGLEVAKQTLLSCIFLF